MAADQWSGDCLEQRTSCSILQLKNGLNGANLKLHERWSGWGKLPTAHASELVLIIVCIMVLQSTIASLA